MQFLLTLEENMPQDLFVMFAIALNSILDISSELPAMRERQAISRGMEGGNPASISSYKNVAPVLVSA
jgi:hypothetical protein